MKQRSGKNQETQNIGFFKAISIQKEKTFDSEFIFEIQKEGVGDLDANLMSNDDDIHDIQIWNAIDSKVDISLSSINVSSLKNIFLVAPVSILRIIMKPKGDEEKSKIINLSVKNLCVIRKDNEKEIFVRFSPDFTVITKKAIIDRYKKALVDNNDKFLKKVHAETKAKLFDLQKYEVNKKYRNARKFFRISKDKEYEINIFNKIDYHATRMSVLEEFLYNEIIKSVLANEEFPELNKESINEK